MKVASQEIADFKSNNHVPDFYFKKWCFLDTNCVSLAVKMYQQGHSEKVKDFFKGKFILIASTVVQELAVAKKDFLTVLPRMFSDSLACIVPDSARFWEYEVLVYLTKDLKNANILGLTILNEEFIDLFKQDPGVFEAIIQDQVVSERAFIENVKIISQINFDERDLVVFIHTAINNLSTRILNQSIPPEECLSEFFPCHYIFYYALLYRYAGQPNRQIDQNDFGDLQNLLAAPYCQDFYIERSFAALMNSQIKLKCPPTIFSVAKKLNKRNLISNDALKAIKRGLSFGNNQCPLLADVNIRNYSEFESDLNI